jgi:hypothetical protein
MKRPADSEYAPYYAAYISLVPESEVLGVLGAQSRELADLASSVAADGEIFRYGPGKWSVREVLGHVIDTERVFGYRAFCIARGEQQPLPGFDQNEYAAAADFHNRRLADLASEFAVVREASLYTLRHLKDADWDRRGTASGHPVSVRAVAFMMAGHVRHHLKMLEERYGVKPLA